MAMYYQNQTPQLVYQQPIQQVGFDQSSAIKDGSGIGSPYSPPPTEPVGIAATPATTSKTPNSNKRWIWIGAGIAAVAVIAILIGLGVALSKAQRKTATSNNGLVGDIATYTGSATGFSTSPGQGGGTLTRLVTTTTYTTTRTRVSYITETVTSRATSLGQ